MDSWVSRANDWDDLGNQIDTFAVYEPTDNHHVDSAVFSVASPALAGVRRKLVWVHGIGEGGKQDGMEASSQREILATGVGDAYAVVEIGEDEAHDLVNVDTGGICKAKQRMICVDQFVTYFVYVRECK